MSQYLSWIEGPPPKRNAVGSNPIWDAKNNATNPHKHWVCGFFALLSGSGLSALVCPKQSNLKRFLLLVCGKMRVMSDSFYEWLSTQKHYKIKEVDKDAEYGQDQV